MTRLQKLKRLLRNPAYRPLEIWLLRTAFAATCTYLGIDFSHLL